MPNEHPAAPSIQAYDPIAEAARKTLLYHFQCALTHEAGTRQGKDIEALHDMRVAVRRMRTAARVFGKYLDKQALAPHLKQLKHTGQILGKVRDMDVFWQDTLLYIESLPDTNKPDLTLLQTIYDTAYAHYRADMVKYLESDTYKTYKQEFEHYLHSPWASIDTSPPQKIRPVYVRDIAPIIIYKRLATVRAYASWIKLPDIPSTRYHRLRVAAKRLRYTLEYFQDILGEETQTAIQKLKTLQDHLGALQDAVVATGHLHNILTWKSWTTLASPPVSSNLVTPGFKTYVEARQQDIQELQETFPGVWRDIEGTSFSQLIANAVSVL